MKEPLYRFHLNETTGILTKLIISDYTIRHPSPLIPSRIEYSFRILGQYAYVRDSQLDRLLHWRVYTFDPNVQHARNIILNELQAKKDKAYEDYLKYSQVIENLELNGTVTELEKKTNENIKGNTK